MLHCEKNDLMTKQKHHCLLPLGWVGLPIKNFHSLLLSCPPKPFSHRILQRFEFGPPPCQCSSVFGVIEVGALSTEAARSLLSKIAAFQIKSIRGNTHLGAWQI